MASNPLPPLVEGSSIYKLVIPKSVEEKIRYLIRKFPNTEWSGILFCTHQGTFENNDLIVTCQDIYPMDLGSSGWTEFKMSEDVAAYMAEHIELFACDLQLVHSHHSIGAFFSGQDIAMLQQEGNDTNCFVSLIVDTKGTYVARITRKVKQQSEVKCLGESYEFFGEGCKQLSNSNSQPAKVISKEYIEYFNMEIERHEVPNTLSYLDERFDEIIKKKQNTSAIPQFRNAAIGDSSVVKELNLFNEYPKVKNEIENSAEVEWIPDAKKIHAAVVHIITCSLIINPDKVDLKQWVSKHMVNVYRKVFGDDSESHAAKYASSPFNEWKDYIVATTMDYFDYDPSMLYDNTELLQSKVATAICDELFEYLDYNDYIKAYYNDFLEYTNI